MFCTNCGSKFDDGNSFCPNCGAKVETVAQPVAEPVPVAAPVEAASVQATPVEAIPVQPAPAPAPAPAPVQPVTPVQPVYTQVPVTPIATAPQSGDNGSGIMVLGILAIAFGAFYILAPGGIICGAIGLSKAKKFIEENGQLFGKAKIGKFLSLGGLILSCVMTGIILIYFIALIAGIASEL